MVEIANYEANMNYVQAKHRSEYFVFIAQFFDANFVLLINLGKQT